MRRNHVLWAGSLLLAGGLIAAWMVGSLSKPDRDIVAKQPPGADGGPSLPLSQVVLFSSGVGYFQREGEVEGNARVDLEFPIGDVNDLLKSLVLQDLGHGKIGPIAYDGQEPVDKTLRSFSVDLTGNPSFGQLLNQARGEKVEIVMQQNAANQPGTLTGVVMGMESEVQASGPGSAHEVHLLNLLCAEGMRSVNLREVQRVRFLNSRLEGELRKALDVLAASRDELKKQISLNFKGEGKRKVRVGYVVENPIWKTSYRLSVDGEQGKENAKSKVQLQGWAAVENVTDEDWNDVRVVLLSGRPISFQMDMYPPLFVPRPTVEPETFASLRPPTYDGALTRSKVDEMMANNANANANLAMNPMANPGVPPGGFAGAGGFGGNALQQQQANLGVGGGFAALNGFSGGGISGGGGGLNGGQVGNNMNRYQNPRGNILAQRQQEDESNSGPGAGAGNNGNRLTYDQLRARRDGKKEQLDQAKQQAKAAGKQIAGIDAHGKLLSEAASDDLGGQVRYVIEDRISLPRQKSALLPLLDKEIEASRVSIFNESIHAKYPVLGLRVKNTSGQPLTQGPVTVYEDGNYAGDARLSDLQPNEVRLISYAVDLGTEVKVETTSSIGPAMTVSNIGDMVQVHHTVRETRKYVVRNRSERDRLMVIEHPIRDNWELAKGVKAIEKSRDVYRFDVTVPAGKDIEFEVPEEQKRTESFATKQETQKDGVRTVHIPTNLELHVALTTRMLTPVVEKVRVVKGEVLVTNRVRAEQSYRVLNTSEKESRDITVRHRVGQDWHIVTDSGKAGLQTKDYPLKLAPGKDGRVDTVNEREQVTTVPGAQFPIADLEKLLTDKSLSNEVKAALKKILDQRVALEDQRGQVVELEKRLKEIGDEQDRLRKNIANLPPTSAAYKRYLEKFDKQETEIEGLQAQVKKLKETERTRQKELMDWMAGLNVE